MIYYEKSSVGLGETARSLSCPTQDIYMRFVKRW